MSAGDPSSSLAAPSAHTPTASIAALQNASIVKSFDTGLLKGPETESHERSETVLAVEDQKIVSSRLGIFREYDRTPKPKKPVTSADSYTKTASTDGASATAVVVSSPEPTSTDTTATATSADKGPIVLTASTGSDGSADSWVNLGMSGTSGSTSADSAAAAPPATTDDGFLQVGNDSGHARMGTAIVIPSDIDESDEPVLLAVSAESDVVPMEDEADEMKASTGSYTTPFSIDESATTTTTVTATEEEEEVREAMAVPISVDGETPTALSLWQAQRTKVLADRRANERREQEERLQAAEEYKSDLRQKRQEFCVQARAEKSGLESGVRQELMTVFQRGSIWEQVARMVDLTKSDPRIERMRNLIIQLKSE